MNGHTRFCRCCIIVIALLVAYIGYELAAFAASSSPTVNVTISRRRVNPGETVEFGLKLTDSQGRSQTIPRTSSPPQLVLTDSQGRTIGKYTFSFG